MGLEVLETHGCILISRLKMSPQRIKNVGVWLTYDSRSGTRNMYREYRDLTVSGAITLCCKWYVGAANHLRLCNPVTQMSMLCDKN